MCPIASRPTFRQDQLVVIGTTALVKVAVGDSEWIVMGGGGYNVAVAARRTSEVALVTVVGDDVAQGCSEAFRRVTVPSYLRVASGPTCRFVLRYSRDFETPPEIDCEYGVGVELTEHALTYDYSDVALHVSCRHPLNTAAVLAAAITDRPGRLTIDFIGSSLRHHLSAALPYLAHVDAVFVNEREYAVAEPMLGECKFTGLTVVTNGAHGARVLHGADVVCLAPAMPVCRVVEPSGAGDALAGGFIATLARGGALVDALRTGVQLGGLAVQGVGVDAVLASGG